MENRKFFRGAFNGFHRQDVLNYIDELRGEQHKELTEMQEQVTRMQQQREAEAAAIAEAYDLREQVANFDTVKAAFGAQIEELQAQKAAVEEENGKLTATVESQEQQIRELTEKLEEANRSIATMWEAQRQLEQSVITAQAFADDVRALLKTLGDDVEKCAVARFEGDAEPTAEAQPAEPSSETATRSGNMENWLY